MPASVSNAKNFLLTTDFPTDKIVYLLETQITSGALVDVNITHGLPFTPLPTLQWSLTSDFNVSYEDNVGPFPSGNIGYTFSHQLTIEADSTKLTLRGNGVSPSITVFVRIFCFPPSDYTGTANSTSSLAEGFVLNTDDNYMKLIDTGKVSVAGGGTSVQSFPYTPHLLAWRETSLGVVSPMSLSWPGFNANVEVGTNSFTVRNDSFSTITIHYRSYIDEQA